MANRLSLDKMLRTLPGNPHVYFQPPEDIKMQYPAIKYSLSRIRNQCANDEVYRQSRFYQLIVIDRDPDSTLSDAVSKLPKCAWDRSYTSNGLNHHVYTIYH